MSERFTDRARRIVDFAEADARARGHDHVGCEHLLLGLIEDSEGVGAKTLEGLDISLEDLQRQVDAVIGRGEPGPPFGEIPHTAGATKVLELALEEGQRIGLMFVGSETILLGLVREGDSRAAHLLLRLGADLGRVREGILRLLMTYAGPGPRSNGTAWSEKSPLERFGRNLMEGTGRLEPVIGRTEQIREVMRVLLRHATPYPILIGEPGVGKTSVVEGLARAIASGPVPKCLAGKHIYTLELDSLVAGSRDRDEVEARLEPVFEEIIRRGNIIVFLDDVHTLIGARDTYPSPAARPLAEAVRSRISQRELQFIGATTPDAYDGLIAVTPALRHRVQPIHIPEPSIDQAIDMLRGLRPLYQSHHDVIITDAALTAAVAQSHHFVGARRLPEKAINLIDEAAARARLTDPPDLHGFDTEIAAARRDQHAAAEAGDWTKAARFRDTQQRLIAERAAREKDWQNSTSGTTIDREHVLEVLEDWTGITLSTLPDP
ncbi:Clp protease N-terminal domain-containing protein [Nocardia sp. NBC_01327]|uniref:Clp protease N-terminal domain-containing protein n=1 Tax=Nocardia sp. NBC_01327 TaxID=2903593 RepID=UPI002E0DB85D|nr:AAA family ATPase [Nocardia sp. NBC_01327]